jgi:hypothetical protein
MLKKGAQELWSLMFREQRVGDLRGEVIDIMGYTQESCHFER